MENILFYFIDARGQLCNYAQDGTVTKFWRSDYAKSVQVAHDGTVWIIQQQPNKNGGSMIQYWDAKNELFRDGHNTHLGPGAISLMSTMTNGVLYVEENGNIGKITETERYDKYEIFHKYRAASVDVVGNGYLWAIGSKWDANNDGYKVSFRNFKGASDWTFMKTDIDAVRLSAYNGNCYTITSHNEVVAYDTKGNVGHWSPEGEFFAFQVSAGKSGLFVISSEVDTKLGGNIVKKWNSSAEAWDKLPVVATSICAMI